MDLIKKQTFIRADGSTLEADAALANKELILIYFSAHWCPPCKRFTPILKEFYDKVAKDGVEIIFLSWDQTPEEMVSYMKESHGDWLAFQHDSEMKEKLEEKFNVCGIPSLVVLKADGTLVTEDGADDIEEHEASEVIKEWKEYDEKANEFSEIIKGSSLVKADDSTKLIEEVLAEKEIVLIYFSGHWCPPCRTFTPVLKKFYQNVSEKGVEVIFVSSDESKEDMVNYMNESHGDWYAFDHGSKIGQKLKKKFHVSGIPTLVALKTDGTILNEDATDDIEKGPSIIDEWKSM